MDPVTTAIVAAIVAGAAGGVAEASMVEGYTANVDVVCIILQTDYFRQTAR